MFLRGGDNKIYFTKYIYLEKEVKKMSEDFVLYALKWNVMTIKNGEMTLSGEEIPRAPFISEQATPTHPCHRCTQMSTGKRWRNRTIKNGDECGVCENVYCEECYKITHNSKCYYCKAGGCCYVYETGKCLCSDCL